MAPAVRGEITFTACSHSTGAGLPVVVPPVHCLMMVGDCLGRHRAIAGAGQPEFWICSMILPVAWRTACSIAR